MRLTKPTVIWRERERESERERGPKATAMGERERETDSIVQILHQGIALD